MKKLCLVLILAGILLPPYLIQAQETNTKIGVGASIGQNIDMSFYYELFMPLFDFPSFYIPIRISDRFKLEPWFGLYRFKNYDNDKMTYMPVGSGLFFISPRGKLDVYYGIRFGIFFEKLSNDHDNSEIDFMIGPVLGGEYFLTSNFSLGGELQLYYYNFSDSDSYYDDESTYSFFTKTSVFLRWYIWGPSAG